MQLQLIISNDRRCLPTLRAFLDETMRQWPLDADVVKRLGECAVAAATAAIDDAYPAGDEGSIELTIRDAAGRLEFLVRDFGLPQDIAGLERRKTALAWPGADAADELHWIGYGREGKAIQIVKYLHEDHVGDTAAAADLERFRDDVPLAPPQEYAIRRMRTEEATQVSQLMYRAYGNTYFNEDVYFPDRVAAHNANDSVLSFVAVAADGRVVGHYALERNDDGPVAEIGQAVVDPAHRGRGLLDRMKDAALAAAKRLRLAGVYADAVTVHTMTQQSDIKHGAHLACVDLAISPRHERFKAIAGDLPQRLTCLLFFQWLAEPTPRTVYLPPRHREIVTAIYGNLACPVEFGAPAAALPAGHGTLTVKFDAGAAVAFLRAEELAADTVHLIRHAKREAIEHSRAEVVYVELPLADPATPVVAEELEADGFGFLGIAPCASPRGDVLRLAYLVEPLTREPIKTVDAFAARMVDYTLAEQARVQAAL